MFSWAWTAVLKTACPRVIHGRVTSTYSKSRKVKRILLLLDWYSRSYHSGAARYAREAGWVLDATAAHTGVSGVVPTWRGDGILVNAVCPGWVATDMGGWGGRPVEEGARGIVWAATLTDDEPTGGFFRDRKRIEW